MGLLGARNLQFENIFAESNLLRNAHDFGGLSYKARDLSKGYVCLMEFLKFRKSLWRAVCARSDPDRCLFVPRPSQNDFCGESGA